VTGRDERIPQSLRSTCKQIELHTGAAVDNDTSQDIRRFFSQRFSEIGGPSLTDWPGKTVLDTLTNRAAGLFIWAETVVRFIEQGLPDEQLEHVLDGDLGEGDSVTELYRQILELLFQKASDRTLNVFNQVVTAIVLAKIPRHVDELSAFISLPIASVTFILDKLSSVISVGRDFGIHINHLSFTEFMCDPHRCPRQFYIDRCKGSHKMSITCFRLMKNGLKFNICDLETSHLRNGDVMDLSERIAAKIRQPLLYSCFFWAAHIRDTPTDLEEGADLIRVIKDFFQSRFLYWLEVMSVTEEVVAANIAVLAVAGWIQVSGLLVEVQRKLKGINIITSGARWKVVGLHSRCQSVHHQFLHPNCRKCPTHLCVSTAFFPRRQLDCKTLSITAFEHTSCDFWA
jgi:hypothetical protein